MSPKQTHAEDWSEIESLLASPGPTREGLLRLRSRRYAVPIMASTLVSSVVFAGVLTAALGGMPEWGCGWRAGCGTPRVAATPVSEHKADASGPAAKPDATALASRIDAAEAVRANRVADVAAEVTDAVPPSPVVQGRSASEAEPEAPAEPAAAVAEPKHHRHHHHHHR